MHENHQNRFSRKTIQHESRPEKHPTDARKASKVIFQQGHVHSHSRRREETNGELGPPITNKIQPLDPYNAPARHPQSSTKAQSSSRSQNSTRAQSSTRDQSSESSKLQEGRAPRKLRDPEDLRAGRELRDPPEFSAPKQLRAPRNPRELRAPQEPKIDERVENGSMMTTMMRRQEDNDDIRTSNTR